MKKIVRGLIRDEIELARPQQLADATDAAREVLEIARPQQLADATNAAREVLELARPQQIADAADAAEKVLEINFFGPGALDRLRFISVAPHITLDMVEKRSKLASQQAVSFVLKESIKFAASTERLLQYLPGFINAMASVPALANLIRQQRCEIDALQALEKSREGHTEKYQDDLSKTISNLEYLGTSVKSELSDIISKISAIEQHVVYTDKLHHSRSEADRGSFEDEMVEQRRLVEVTAKNVECRVIDAEKLLISELEKSRDLIESEMVEQRRLWEAISKNNVETGNLWKSAELATREIGNLWQRTEFIRSEILYEMKYGLDGEGHNREANVAANRRRSDIPPQIRNSTVIDESPPEGFKVNLGCGHIARAGYVNVDARQLPGVDVVANLASLPFLAGSVFEFYSSHVLEHFPEEQLRRLLPYWRGLMKPGGSFVAVVPDGEASLAAVADGTSSFADFREVLFGGQEYEGDFHFNLFTPDSLAEMLEQAGFRNIIIVEKGRRNGNCFEFEIGAEA